MGQHTDNLAALIGSRICHDLISPIGAVTNGLELMSMAGGQGPELDLVNESAANANARIRLFRLAFGQATPDQSTSGEEIRGILKDVYDKSRVTIDWTPPLELPRADAQVLMLALLCCEQAIPQGGTITVTQEQRAFTLIATGPRIMADPSIWENLGRPYPNRDIAPSQVQFALLPRLLAERGKTCTYRLSQGEARLAL
ncbi:histidine phosphotransferase family protein [uncultured Roseovarius sp.]|uniref:histidine phosphotransferase family protein n=1 Tax=uncultured Roseovarius sp. TaxID=293344 RepID=UPI0025D328FF|nr:histidine phosphotransferase family protein [uncultured Roseovarius sp.]